MSITLKCTPLVIAALVSTPVSAAEEIIRDYPATGVTIGYGWDSLKGEKTTGSCVVASSVTDTGQHRLPDFQEVSDNTSLMRALSASAKIKARSLWGGSGSARSSFARTVNVDTSALTIVVNAVIEEGVQHLVNPRDVAPTRDLISEAGAAKLKLFGSAAISARDGLVEEAVIPKDEIRLTPDKARLAARRPAEFRLVCGDSFVSMIRKASGIQGIVTATTRSERERSEVSGAVQATFGPVSGDATASQKVDRLKSESRLSIHYYQLGGSGSPIATSPDEFRKLVQSVGTLASPLTAAPYEIGLMSYSALRNFPRQRNLSLGDMDAMAAQYYRLVTLTSYVSDVLTNPAKYLLDTSAIVPNVKVTQVAMADDMRSLADALRACDADPANCKFPAGVSRTDYKYRTRMPLTRIAAQDWAELQAAQSALPAAQKLVETTPETKHSYHRGGRQVPNPDYRRAVEARDAIAATIARLKDAFNNDEQRFRTFIALPARERCARGEDDVCLNEAEIDALRSQMVWPAS